MNGSEFPIEKTDERLAEFNQRAEVRPSLHGNLESPMVVPATPGYDSLLEYWRIVFRHRKLSAAAAQFIWS